MDLLVSNVSAQNEKKQDEMRVCESETQGKVRNRQRGKNRQTGYYQSDTHQKCSRILAYLLDIHLCQQ